MKATRTILMLLTTLFTASCFSHGDSDPLLAHVMLHELEARGGDGDAIEAEAWIGKDVNKFWLKADAERHHGNTEEAEVQALYSRAVTAFWDLQLGARHDIKPTPTRDWAVIGLYGLTPYFFDMDAALFIGQSGHTAARFSAKYELLFTQRLILTPAVEINLHGQNDRETDTGSGLSNATAGLRLRYEIRREFAPYVGFHWEKKYGNTADFEKTKGGTVSDSQFVVGLHAWF